MRMKKDIRAYEYEELQKELERLGEKPFRAKQIYEWLHVKLADRFDEMTNLSVKLREKLAEEYDIFPVQMSALAAVAGVLLCSAYPSLTPYTGAMPGIKAFVAAVFGGIGSIPGAFIGGILLGVIEIFGKAYISSQMADAIVFAVLIIVLLVKPTGLLGKKIQEKV